METVRILQMPACKMVASPQGMFGDGILEDFSEWFGQFDHGGGANDYLWFNGKGFVWYYRYQNGMKVPDHYQLVTFPGGLYAVSTSIDGDERSYQSAHENIDRFLYEHDGFLKDSSRAELGHIITPPQARSALGYEQMEHYIPILLRKENNL